MCSRLPALMLLGGPLMELAADRLHLDLLHDPSGVSPFTVKHPRKSVKRVTTIYDAIPFRYPHVYPWLNNFVHRRYVPATLRNVDGIVTISKHARNDLARFLDVPERDWYILPPAPHTRFEPVDKETARITTGRYGLTGEYVLSVGAQQARKNLPRLVEAFALVRLALPRYRLVVVGPTLWRYSGLQQKINELGLQDHVSILGYVADEDLPALYSAASLFAFPSLYEGFGLPVLEAMACRTPVVCSNSSSLPEVAADAAVLVDPTNTEALAEAMCSVLRDVDLKEELCRRGLQRAREFSWEKTARGTVAMYRELLGQDNTKHG
jgi:glycosyltransferase involved in cell wall biosynthesis